VFSQDNQYLRRDLNGAPAEYEQEHYLYTKPLVSTILLTLLLILFARLSFGLPNGLLRSDYPSVICKTVSRRSIWPRCVTAQSVRAVASVSSAWWTCENTETYEKHHLKYTTTVHDYISVLLFCFYFS
jgi:hypothetical protein